MLRCKTDNWLTESFHTTVYTVNNCDRSHGTFKFAHCHTSINGEDFSPHAA